MLALAVTLAALLAIAPSIGAAATRVLPERWLGQIRMPDGDYEESSEDLRVSVLGSHVTVTRTWFHNRWYFNSAWAPLRMTYDSRDGSISAVDRVGWLYERISPGVFRFDERNTIHATATGYRWEDRRGNWIEYDDQGNLIRYGDRNLVQVALRRDAEGRVVEVLDHFGTAVVTFEHTGDQITAVRDRSGRRVVYHYSGALLEQVTDVLGYPWRYSYDAAGQLTARTDPENRTRTIQYAPNGKVSAIIEPDGARVDYGYDYDSTRRLLSLSIMSAEGNRRELWYDLRGQLKRQDDDGQNRVQTSQDGRTVTRTDAAGNRTVDELDEWSNVLRRTHPDGSVETWEYEPRFSNVVRYVDPKGNVTAYEYDSRGNALRKIEAEGRPESRVTEYRYDQYGNRILARRLADARTEESSYSYRHDDRGHVIEATDPEGSVTRYEYEIEGNLTLFVDGRGKPWSYTYDVAGQLLTETDPLGNTRSYQYDKVGNLTQYTDARGKPSRYEYDARNRMVRTVDPFGHAATVSYDRDGLPISTTDEDGKAQVLSYDALKRVKGVRDGRGNAIVVEYGREGKPEEGSAGPIRIVYPTFEKRLKYDRRNRISEEANLVDTELRSFQFLYDANGNRSSTTGPDGKTSSAEYDALDRQVTGTDTLGHTTRFTYDNRDNLVTVEDAKGRLWRFTYDRDNRLIREIKPRGEEVRYEYDDDDNVTAYVNAKGERIEYAFDDAGRLVLRREFLAGESMASKTVVFSYDQEDNLTGWSDGTQGSQLTYDDLGRLLAETIDLGPFRLTYSYEYHANGLKKALIYPGGLRYGYGYDGANNLDRVEIPFEGSISIGSFLWNAPAQVTLPGGTTERHEYDGLLSLTAARVTDVGGNVVSDLSNRYGALSELQQRTLDGAATTFEYDSEVRLSKVGTPDETQESFALDPVHNRLADEDTADWEYDDNNRLLRRGDTTYAYDADGNLVQTLSANGERRFAYDVRGRLVKVEDGAGKLIARYNYDPFGRRLSKFTDGSTRYFLYAEEGLIGEYNALGEEIVAYGWRPDGIWGTAPLFLKVGANHFYYHNDHLGTPLKLTNRRGEVVWAATYAAFGRASVSLASSVESNLRLGGQYFDRETGLHYNYLRYYDPDTGRYTQFDPLGLEGSLNGYAYTDGNPTNLIDPYGDVIWVPFALYAKCVADCGLTRTVVGVIDGDCIGLDTVSPCLKECLNPLEWVKLPGSKLLKRLLPKGKRGPPPGKKPGPESKTPDRKKGVPPLTPGKKLPDDRIIAAPPRRGAAPIGDDGKSVELHHRGQKMDSPVDEMTRADHRGKGNFSKNHDNTGQEKSNIDRDVFEKQKEKYWEDEWDRGRFKNMPDKRGSVDFGIVAQSAMRVRRFFTAAHLAHVFDAHASAHG